MTRTLANPPITSFTGKYAFLSNFEPCFIRFELIGFRSVEHAFQAAKTLNIEERMNISALRTPGQAKRAGRKLKLRADWEEVKVEIMRDLVFQKFWREQGELWEKLVNTGNSKLVEGNNWHDNFWGNCTCPQCKNIQGKNMLGEILMEVRESLAP